MDEAVFRLGCGGWGVGPAWASAWWAAARSVLPFFFLLQFLFFLFYFLFHFIYLNSILFAGF
jgi:hypothetical protein